MSASRREPPGKWVFDTYKSKSGTLAAAFKYPPDTTPAAQANRIMSMIESVP